MKDSIKKYFENRLIEMSVAIPGDWDEYMETLGDISETIIEKNWKLILNKKFNKFDMEIRRQNNTFIVGYYIGSNNDKRFKIVLRIALYDVHKLPTNSSIKNLYSVVGVGVLKEFHGMGIATFMYKYLVNGLNLNLLGDELQYFGARKLWNRLSKELDIRVDVMDFNTFEVVKESVDLKHGKLDDEYNKEYWSSDYSKANIRFILRKIN